MITINLFDYGEELKRIKIQKYVLGSVVAIFLAGICLPMGEYFLEKIKIGGLEGEVAEVRKEVKSRANDVKKIEKMQTDHKRLNEIIAGVKLLRSDELTPTQLLTDIEAAIPEGLWLSGISQRSWSYIFQKKIPVIFVKNPKETNAKTWRRKIAKLKAKGIRPKDPFIEIIGGTYTDQPLAKFIEGVEKIPYFKGVFLFKNEQIYFARNGVEMTSREFRIFCYLGEDPEISA